MTRQLQFYCNRCCRVVDRVQIDYRGFVGVADIRVECHGEIETLQIDEQDIHNMDFDQIGNAFAEEGPIDTPWYDPAPVAVEYDVIDTQTLDGRTRRHRVRRFSVDPRDDLNSFLAYDYRRYR